MPPWFASAAFLFLKGSHERRSNRARDRGQGLECATHHASDLNANIVLTEIVKHVSQSGQVLRWAVLTTRSGFAVTSRPSASVSSANDNTEIGEKVAIDNVKQDLWLQMSYELRSKLVAQ